MNCLTLFQPVTKYDVAAHGLTGVSRFSLDRGGVVRKIKSKLSGRGIGAGQRRGRSGWLEHVGLYAGSHDDG